MMKQIDLEKLLEGNEVLQEIDADAQELVIVMRIAETDWYDSVRGAVENYGSILKEYRIIKAGK